MKLELKHLAPYLPYDLQMIGCQSKLSPMILEKWQNDEWDITPILKPLHEINWQMFIDEKHRQMSDAIHDFIDAFNDDVANQDVLIMSAPYTVFEWCLENHFDVFSLIPKGLAIDINTLPVNG